MITVTYRSCIDNMYGAATTALEYTSIDTPASIMDNGCPQASGKTREYVSGPTLSSYHLVFTAVVSSDILQENILTRSIWGC